MVHSLKILDKDYKQWVKQIAVRYRGSQIKAAIKVNTEQLRFYWQLGKDIVEMKVEERWGVCHHSIKQGFAKTLAWC